MNSEWRERHKGTGTLCATQNACPLVSSLELEGTVPLTLDEFTQMAEEELALLPAYVHEELNGGVLVDPEAYLHPARVEDDLYILGTYSNQPVMGKQIVLYYGSFLMTMQHSDRERWRMQIRDTLRHEFQHHLETRAGLFYKDTLVEEDYERMMTYFMRHKK